MLVFINILFDLCFQADISTAFIVFRNNTYIAKYLPGSIIVIQQVSIAISNRSFILNFWKGTLEINFIFFLFIYPWCSPTYLPLCYPILTNFPRFSLLWDKCWKQFLKTIYPVWLRLFFSLFLCFFPKDVHGLLYFARKLENQEMTVWVVEIVPVHATIHAGNISIEATIHFH